MRALPAILSAHDGELAVNVSAESGALIAPSDCLSHLLCLVGKWQAAHPEQRDGDKYRTPTVRDLLEWLGHP